MRLRSFGLAKHFSVFFFDPVNATLISWRDRLRSWSSGSTHREFHAKFFLSTSKLLGFCIENNIPTVASSSSFGIDVSSTETGVLGCSLSSQRPMLSVKTPDLNFDVIGIQFRGLIEVSCEDKLDL